MFSPEKTNHENEPSKAIGSAVFVRNVFLGADASNRVRYCGPGIFCRRDVSRERGVGAHANKGRVRDIRVVLFGVHISGGVAQCGGSRSVYDLWVGAGSPAFFRFFLAALGPPFSGGAWTTPPSYAFFVQSRFDLAHGWVPPEFW